MELTESGQGGHRGLGLQGSHARGQPAGGLAGGPGQLHFLLDTGIAGLAPRPFTGTCQTADGWLVDPATKGWPQGPNGPPLSGGIHSREGSQAAILPTIPWRVLPDGPPNTRGPLEVLVGLFYRFFGLSWETF